jgi:lysozyme
MQSYDSTINILGMDCSSYQSPVDWKKAVAKGVKFALLRTYGSSHSGTGDTAFSTYITQAKAVGIPTGTYFYAMPKIPLDISDAHAQAQQFIDKLQSGYGTGNYGDLINYVDVEDNSGVSTAGQAITSMPKSDLITWILEFKNYYQSKTNRVLGLYTSDYFWNDLMGGLPSPNPLSDMPLWTAGYQKYARYATNVPDYGGWTKWNIWQYSEDGVGIDYGVASKTVDLNYGEPIDMLKSKMLKPTPPSNFVATVGDGQVTLSWLRDTDPKVIGHNLYKNNVWIKYVSATTTSYVVTGLTNSTQYNFCIDSDNGTLSDKACVNATPIAPKPSVPTGLKVVVGDRSLTVSWSANPELDIRDYSLFMNGSLYNTTPSTSELITGLINGATYNFQVVANNTKGYSSDKSISVSGIPVIEVPSTPQNVVLTLIPKVKVTWVHTPNENFSHYEVYKKGVLVATDITVQEYTTDELTPNQQYQYNVVAVDKDGDGSWSANSLITINFTTP